MSQGNSSKTVYNVVPLFKNVHNLLIHNKLLLFEKPMLVKGKTHAWFVGHRTIVHGRLKHCSFAIEQLFVEA